MAVDLSSIVNLTTQINALQGQLERTTDATAKAVLSAQIAGLQAQLTAEASHQQAQVDASNNLLNGLGLFNTLTQTVGTAAPAIINLFK